MIGLVIGIVLVAGVIVAVGIRMVIGPDDANRAAASDLLFFAVIALFAMIGALRSFGATFDVVLIASVVGFLASVSLARAVSKGRR